MIKSKVAFITGITGQDGSYLCELLLEKGYIVHGLVRRSSLINTHRIDHLYVDSHNPNARLFLHYGDMTDTLSLFRILNEIEPDEVYNLAAMSHVRVSFETPEITANVDALGVLRILDICKSLKKPVKFYQAGTSELYGGIYDEAHTEMTPFNPRSPYAVSKLFGHWITKNYRESYGMFAVNGILHNHTSPRRGETFVEQKIVKAAIAIKHGLQDCLYLGNIYTFRDIGHSKDFVRAIWLMLQQENPIDYVIASGEKIMIKDIVDFVFSYLGMKLVWNGIGIDETASYNGKVIIKINSRYYRPSEVDSLLGDSTKARKELGWMPEYTLKDTLIEMIEVERTRSLKDN